VYRLVPLLFAVGVRAVYGWQYWHRIPYARAPVVDAEVYVHFAQTLRAGQWSDPELIYSSFLYPYFLALFPLPPTGSFVWPLVAQLALGVVNVWLVMQIVRALWNVPWLVVASGIAYTLTSPLLFFESKLYAETLAVTTFLVVLHELVAGRRAWALGLACGVLALERTEALLFLPIALFRIYRSDGIAPAKLAAVLVPVILCLSLAAVRNTRIAGSLVLSPTVVGGLQFHLGNNPNARGSYSRPEGFHGTLLQDDRLARRLAEEAAGRPLGPMEVDRYWWRQGIGYLAANPAAAVVLFGRKLAGYLAVRDVILDLGFYSERAELPLLRLMILPFPALLLLALVGFVTNRMDAHARPARDAVALALLPSLIVCLVFYAQSRYRLSGAIAALVLAPGGVLAVLGAVRTSAVVRGATALAVVAMAVWGQGLTDPIEDHALARYNEGVSFERLGDAREALAHYTEAFALAPRNPAVRNNYARALAAIGQRERGQQLLEEGVAADPRATDLRISLGWMLYRQGRTAEAEQHFAEALRLEPANLSAKLSVAYTTRDHARDRDSLQQVAHMFREVAAENHPAYTRPALLGLGMTYGALGEAAQIDPVFQRLAQLGPLSSIEESEWGFALYSIGRHGDARTHLEASVALDPGNAAAHYRLALVQQALGNTEAAAASLQTARALGLSAPPP
jgi:tetratricopeptide (TPR) repeat protein